MAQNDKSENIFGTLFVVGLSLTIVQAIFLGTKRLAFLFVEETLFSRSMVTMASMLLGIFMLYLAKKYRGIRLSALPLEFGRMYVAATLLTVVFFAVTLFLINGFSLQNMLMLLYSGIVTPVFEELLFRGAIWNRLQGSDKSEWTSYLCVTILFGLWHIGYAIGIYMWQGGTLLRCILMKVLWGTLYGLFLGIFRVKTRNCYLEILVHGVLNVFG